MESVKSWRRQWGWVNREFGEDRVNDLMGRSEWKRQIEPARSQDVVFVVGREVNMLRLKERRERNCQSYSIFFKDFYYFLSRVTTPHEFIMTDNPQ